MAPEQLRGGEVDRRTDVYAAGVVLWETLTLQRSLHGQNEGEIVTKVLERPVEAPSAMVPYVLPAGLDEVTLRALAREPSQRFETARQMALALEAAVPVASPTRVGEWIDDLAGTLLARRAKTVAVIERESGDLPPLDETEDAAPLRQTEILASGVHEQPARRAPEKRRGAVVFAACAFAGAGIALLAASWSREPPAKTAPPPIAAAPSAAPPAAPIAATDPPPTVTPAPPQVPAAAAPDPRRRRAPHEGPGHAERVGAARRRARSGRRAAPGPRRERRQAVHDHVVPRSVRDQALRQAMRLTARPAFALVALAIVAAPAAARADDADACLQAPVDGQKLQREGKLLRARERFAACARQTCPAEIVQDCTRWTRQVEDALPSIVVAARDGAGRDVLDVRVAIDREPAAPVSARAVDLDPGAHKLVFSREGSAPIEKEIFVREGEKNREVVATFAALVPAPPAPLSPTPEPLVVERPIPPAAWIVGGVGVLGVASFATFGILGLSDRSAHHCDVGCATSDKEAVDTKFRVADVSLAVGAIALGIATWLFLARPTVEHAAHATLRP